MPDIKMSRLPETANSYVASKFMLPETRVSGDSPSERAFLRARWTNLVLANFAVPDALLSRRLPAGLELDRYQGSAFVSIVAFSFLDTRVLGIPWPGCRNFPEWNLRLYVRHGQDRGVMFIREFVRQRLVAWIARAVYNEPYVVAPLDFQIYETPEQLSAEYRLHRGGRTHTIGAVGYSPAVCPGEGTVEHFFKEHCWGFGVSRTGKALRYHVTHPIWHIHPLQSFKFDIDWATLYGDEWSVLQGVQPHSVMLAEGSAVCVYPKGSCP